MRLSLRTIALALLFMTLPAQAESPLKLERTVLLMRHGVRPPTSNLPIDPAIAPGQWPAWDVPFGDLTSHGAKAITLLGAYDRAVLAPDAGCPEIDIYADVDERTLKTGEAFAAGYAPGCAIPVHHADGTVDPVFDSAKDGIADFDTQTAKDAMLSAAGGDLTGPVKANAALFQAMQAVLDPNGSAFLHLPAKISMPSPNRLPKLSGPIAIGATVAEIILLEYLDGKPMSDVGWGRVKAEDVPKLLALHPLAYTLTARPDYIARASAKPLAEHILATLQHGPAVSVIVGHDTNQALIGGLLKLHWSPASYPSDDPPPGGGILFSVLKDDSGTQFVTAAYQVQTMDQIRSLIPLDAQHPPIVQALPIPGCGNSVAAKACTLADFVKLVESP